MIVFLHTASLKRSSNKKFYLKKINKENLDITISKCVLNISNVEASMDFRILSNNHHIFNMKFKLKFKKNMKN